MRFTFDRLTPSGLIRLVAEAVLLFLIVWAPWPFASVEFAWESVLIGGTTLLVLLWFCHALFNGQLLLRPDAVTYILLALALLSAFQLIPLPESVVSVLSSKRVQLHHQMLPATFETLPGEIAVARPTSIPLTLDPFATKVFLAQVLSVTLLYTVVRSWISSRESLRRVAWVATANGFLLALVGVTQFFSSPRNVVFWSVETDGAVFGPFICKNHFPDYVLFCLGLGIGLLVTRQGPKSVKIKGVVYKVNALSKITDSPDLFIIGAGLVLIVMSIPFTLSRGGLLATGLAAAAVAALVYRTRGSLTRTLAIGGGLTLLALLVGAWLGWSAVTERLQTVGTGQASSQRKELWSDVATVIPSFLGTGGGAGSFPRIETITRSEPHPEYYVLENAHNEYLEAILEGGLIRLALTLALCYFSLLYAVQAYKRLHDRSSGPLILGILFGLVGLITHSFVDFGIHMPAVAFLAAVLTAYAADASTDPTYIPYKKNSLDDPQPDRGRKALRGAPMFVFMLTVSAVAVWLLFDSSKRGRAEDLKVYARDTARSGVLNQHPLRLKALEEAVARTPSDGTAWTHLAQAHFDAAEDERRTATMALAGPVASTLPNETFWIANGDHIREGLKAAREARSCSPLLPRPHLFLAIFAEGFATHEPPKVHLERACRASPTDAEIFILRGNDAMKTGDRPAALAHWQKAMTLNVLMVPNVLTVAQKSLTAQEILGQLLPADPVVLYAAVQQLHPIWIPENAKKRVPYLERVVQLDGERDWPSRGWASIARSQAELARSDAAFAAWTKAVAKDSESYDLRNAFSRWLEEDERYAAAEEQLLWLREHRDTRDILDRLEAVRHAQALQDKIRSK